MALFRVGVVQCRGTPYEVGHAQARWFAETAKGRAFLRRKAIRFPQWFDIRAEQRRSPPLRQLFGKKSQGLRTAWRFPWSVPCCALATLECALRPAVAPPS